jgi:sugar/nucleoside kinase (ribokinase family)
MVLVFGTICLDRVRRIAALPQPGGYVGIQSEEVFLGGEAANTANALHAWGADLDLAGNILGDGEDADLLLRKIVEKGIPTEHLRLEEGITPVCDIYVTPDGERTMFGIGFDTITQGVDTESLPYRTGSWFTGDMNLGSVVRDAARQAKSNGMRLYLMDFFEENEPLAEGDFWQSSTDWVGVRGNTQKNVEWLNRLIDRYGCFGILSDGPNGLVAGSPTHAVRHYPPFPAPTFVDSTGAGDMFRAGMLFGLDRNWPIHECLQFAAAAGCLKCAYLGATTHVPTSEEIRLHLCANDSVARQYA